jgi:LPXTG-motif cell wall-anchored protein
MSRLLRLRAAVTATLGLGTVVAGVLAAPVASAADLPAPTVSSPYVHANEPFTIAGTGCTATPGGAFPGVAMSWELTPGDYGGDGAEAEPDGSWQLQESFSSNVAPGVYEFHAVCDDYVSERAYPVVRVQLLAVGEQPPTQVTTPGATQVTTPAATQVTTPGATQVTATPGQSLTPSKPAAPGAKYDYRLTGYAPFEVVTVVLHSTPRPLGTFTADASGVVTIPFTVPTDLSGAHTLQVTRADGTVVSYAVQIAAPAGASRPELAYTGTSITGPLIAGGGLVIIGAGLLFVARRRTASAAQS